MREELHRFFRAARGAGVRVSPAESIDAMKAVADVGFADRGILRDTLLLTLAKSEEEKQALGETFDHERRPGNHRGVYVALRTAFLLDMLVFRLDGFGIFHQRFVIVTARFG